MQDFNKVIDKVADSKNVVVDRKIRAQIAMRLAFAEDETLDEASAEVVVAEVIDRLGLASKVKTAGIIKTASVNNCPRCQKPFVKVHLADNQLSDYCEGCRIVG